MNKFPPPLTHKQFGFSIVEVMIALFLGLFVTAVVLGVFIYTYSITKESNSASEKNENGVFAMQVLSRDLKRTNFFAQATGDVRELWSGIPSSVTDDCTDNLTLGSFPKGTPSTFRPLWGGTVTSSGFIMSCIDDSDASTTLVDGHDYISIKRAKGLSQTSDFKSKAYYLEIDVDTIKVKEGSDTSLVGNTAWEYIHHVYFIDSENNIPLLHRLTLTTDGMVNEGVIAEGIENMQFLYGLDAENPDLRDGAVDQFVNNTALTDSDWDTGRVIGVQVFLLVRSIEPTPGYNGASEYKLGDYTVTTGTNDHYKRQVISRVIKFDNTSRLIQ